MSSTINRLMIDFETLFPTDHSFRVDSLTISHFLSIESQRDELYNNYIYVGCRVLLGIHLAYPDVGSHH